jgi:general secretion pathway protein K
MKHLHKQRGAAIIVALFVTTLVVVASVAMIMRLQIDLRNTELLTHNAEARNDAQGSVAWAIDQLNNDWLKKNPEHVVDLTPIKSPLNKLNQAEITSTIYDPQGRFNINNLIEMQWQDNFSVLITLVDPTIDLEKARGITLAVVDWISPISKNPELENTYLKHNPAYRAAHQLMASVSELRLVKGMTSSLYNALLPQVIALPMVTKININNTTIPILMCLSKTLSFSSAKSILDAINSNPFANVQAFLSNEIIKKASIPQEKITILSDYFLVKTNVNLSSQELQLYTLLQRIIDHAKPYEIVLWQSKGTL